LVSKMMPFDRKMPCARSRECSGVIGDFKASSIIFMDNTFYLMCGDVTASIGETRCLIGQKKPFSEFVKNVSKREKSSGTHGERDVFSFTCAKSNLRFKLADPMDQAT